MTKPQDIRPYLVVGARVEVNTANGWLAGVITEVRSPLPRSRFPRTLVKFDDGYESWTGNRGIRLVSNHTEA